MSPSPLPSPAKSSSTSRACCIIRVSSVVRTLDPRLAEERVQLPKLVLPIIVERVIVALRALHAHPQEQLGRLRGRLHAAVAQLVDQES